MNMRCVTPTASWMHDFKNLRSCSKRLGNDHLALGYRILSVPRFLEYASRVLKIGSKELSSSENDPQWARLQEAYKSCPVWLFLPPSSRFVRGSELQAHKKTLARYDLGQQEEAFVTFENSRNCR